MNTFLALLKTNLNVNFGISALKYRFTREKKRLWEPVLIGISAVIGVGSIISMFTVFLFLVFLGGLKINRPEIVLTISLIAGQILILFFGMFYLMGSFYFSRDLNILIPMPLKPSQVLGSKFAVVMINEYLTLIPILLPAIAIYGIGTGQGFFYWIKGLIVFATAPAIPLAIGALVIMVLMRFVNIRKSKDLLAVIGGLFSIIAAIGINLFAQRMPEGHESELIENLLTSKSGIVELIGQKFPPSIWGTYSLAHTGLDGLGHFLMFTGLSVFLFVALMWLGNRIFYRSVLSGQEITRKRRAMSGNEIDSKYAKALNPVIALFWKEWKLLLRTPVYMLNGIMGMIIAPFLLLMPFFSQNQGPGQEFLSIIQNPENSLLISLGALAFMLFVANMGVISSTSISREGQLFWISRMIPVAPRQQAAAKILHAVAVELFGLIISAAALTIVLKMSILRLLIIFVLSILGTIPIVSLNLMVDILRPRLDWTNPQQAVKNNFNGFLGMLVTALVLGVLAAAAAVMTLLRLPGWLVYLVLGMLMTAFAVPSLIGVFSLAEYRYKDIEV